MSPAVVALVALAAALGGWFGVARLVATLPEPSPLGLAARGTVAVATAAGWAVAAATWERWWQVLPYGAFSSVLVAVAAIDIRVYRIPNKLVFSALGASLPLLVVATLALDPPVGAWPYLRGGLVGSLAYFAFLFVPHLVYPAGMGMGDVKLALLLGLYLGWGHATADAFGIVTAALFVGCVLGVVSGVAVNVARRRSGAFPFGPSLVVGCYVILVRATGTA